MTSLKWSSGDQDEGTADKFRWGHLNAPAASVPDNSILPMTLPTELLT